MTSPKQPSFSPKTSPSNAYNRLNPSSGDRPSANLIAKNGKPSQQHEIRRRGRHNEVHFRPVHDDSGGISPRLWKNIRSPPGSPSRPLLSHRSYQPLSPDSRAHAIARARLELMEMVRHMPESNFELSLKDIVDHHHRAQNQTEHGSAVKVKKEDCKRMIDRNMSFENKGLFLNMVFPVSFLSKKEKKNGVGRSGRVSPKPEALRIGGERVWWLRTGSSDSDRSRTSDGAGGDQRGRRRNGCMTGCFQFLYPRRRRCKSS